MKLGTGSAKNFFVKYFVNYFWAGLILAIFAIMIDDSAWPASTFKSVVVDLVKTIGISVMVASIFTFAAGSSEFFEHIRILLEKIVVHRNFLGNMDSDSKRNALQSLLQPTDDERNIYSKIQEYYSKFMDEALSIGKKPIRENYVITCQAYFDTTKRKIIVDAHYSYTLYRTTEGFKNIVMGYEEGEEESSFHHLCVRDTAGKTIVAEDTIELETKDVNGVMLRRAERAVKPTDPNEKRVHVEMCVTEVGKDHWCLMNFNNLQATNNFQLNLVCDDNVEVKKYSVFFVDAEYRVYFSDDKKNLRINTNQWINEGTGLTILIALPHCFPDDAYPASACQSKAIGKVSDVNNDGQTPAV